MELARCGVQFSAWLQDPLALRLLAGEFLIGETVVADKDGEGGKLKFTKQPANQMEPVTSEINRV